MKVIKINFSERNYGESRLDYLERIVGEAWQIAFLSNEIVELQGQLFTTDVERLFVISHGRFSVRLTEKRKGSFFARLRFLEP